MVIQRHKHRAQFTVMPNPLFCDTRVSLAARGLLGYLLTKPPRWRVDIGDIQRIGNIGRDKAYAILRELQDAGYVRPMTHRTKTGRFTSGDYLISDTPHAEKQDAANPGAVQPYGEKPHGIERTDSHPNTETRKHRGSAGARGGKASKNDARPRTMSEALDAAGDGDDD